MSVTYKLMDRINANKPSNLSFSAIAAEAKSFNEEERLALIGDLTERTISLAATRETCRQMWIDAEKRHEELKNSMTVLALMNPSVQKLIAAAEADLSALQDRVFSMTVEYGCACRLLDEVRGE